MNVKTEVDKVSASAIQKKKQNKKELKPDIWRKEQRISLAAIPIIYIVISTMTTSVNLVTELLICMELETS